MKLTKMRLFVGVGVLGVVITGIFGGLVAGVFTGTLVSGNIFSLRYWQSICFNKRQYNDSLFNLRDRLKVTPLEDEGKNDPSKKKKDHHSEKHSFAFFWHRRIPPLVPGPPVRSNFEGDPDDPIDVINYEIACRYPPLSVLPSGSGQVIGYAPAVLPAYCHSQQIYIRTATSTHGPNSSFDSSPTPCPSPTPSASRDYSYKYCPSPSPSPVPSELSKEKLHDLGSGPGTLLNIPLEAVGALTIHMNSHPNSDRSKPSNRSDSGEKSGSDKENGTGEAEMWGSGFMIADHIFATSCHVLEPLFERDPGTGKLARDDKDNFVVKEELKEKLYVHFAPLYFDRLYNLEHSFSQMPKEQKESYSLELKATYLDCSHQSGLDVAFFTIIDPNKLAPLPVTLFYARDKSDLNTFTAKPAVLITYVDLIHPLDEITSEMYHCFADPKDQLCQPAPTPTPSPTPSPTPLPTPPYQEHVSYGKFIMIDGIVMAESCGGVHLLLDTADTSVGASGALVLDIFKPRDPLYATRPVPLAVGLHKCCAAYFGEVSSYGPPSSLACAALKRTPVTRM